MNKSLLNKFLNDSYYIFMIENFKKFLLHNKLNVFYHIYAEEFQWGVITFRNSHYENLLEVFKTFLEYYLEHLMRYSRNYFDVDDIHLYIINEIKQS